MARPSKRDQLIDTALDLFYREGFHATGIDRILSEAGVAKMTLYKHFRSKDALIEAVLQRRDEQFREWLMQYVESHAGTPRDRLLAVFDANEEWFRRPDYRGCMFLNAAAEFAGNAQPLARLADEHKRLLLGYLRGLAAAGSFQNPDRLADLMLLLTDGAIGCALVSGDASWAEKAKDAAAILIDVDQNAAPVP